MLHAASRPQAQSGWCAITSGAQSSMLFYDTEQDEAFRFRSDQNPAPVLILRQEKVCCHNHPPVQPRVHGAAIFKREAGGDRRAMLVRNNRGNREAKTD